MYLKYTWNVQRVPHNLRILDISFIIYDKKMSEENIIQLKEE